MKIKDVQKIQMIAPNQLIKEAVLIFIFSF